jgi:hypothetical protein
MNLRLGAHEFIHPSTILHVNFWFPEMCIPLDVPPDLKG